MSRVTKKQKSAWSDHVQKQPTSKLSQRAYCARYSLNLRQFGYWRRVFQPTAVPEAKTRQTPSSKFVPVQLTPRTMELTLTITLPNGILIGGIDEGNQHLIPSLLGACQ